MARAIDVIHYCKSFACYYYLALYATKVNHFDIGHQVIRGGERKQVSIWDLVVGDVIPLSIGDQVSTVA
jgi:hypothetical protein